MKHLYAILCVLKLQWTDYSKIVWTLKKPKLLWGKRVIIIGIIDCGGAYIMWILKGVINIDFY